jgi:hypothetical protein
VSPDGSESFGERACSAGSLGLLLGPDILPTIRPLLEG